MFRKLICALAVIGFSMGLAFADSIKGKVKEVDDEKKTITLTVDDKDTTYTVRMGWRPTPYWAVELGYYDLGRYKFHGSGPIAVDGQAQAKSFGISAVGIVPLDAFELYGRLGFARSELKVNASANIAPNPQNAKDKQNEATYGVGGRWWVQRNWSVFAEWMKNDKIEVDSYLVGVDFRF